MDCMRILVVEDEANLRELIKIYLARESWTIEMAENGKKALDLLREKRFNLALIDVMLPDMSGFDVCKYIRLDSTMPIIFLTALESPSHKIKGLEMGGDDYMTKPFEGAELVARIKSQLRRAYQFSKYAEGHGYKGDDKKRHSCGLFLNMANRSANYDNQSINFTPKEFSILWILMERPGDVYPMEEIHKRVWKNELLDYETNPVMVHIRRIRKKLELAGADNIISTVWGVGYKVNV